jgi:hypothetical protein
MGEAATGYMLPTENSSYHENHDQKEYDEPYPSHLSRNGHRKNLLLPSQEIGKYF